jgi:hypothetical protein
MTLAVFDWWMGGSGGDVAKWSASFKSTSSEEEEQPQRNAPAEEAVSRLEVSE